MGALDRLIRDAIEDGIFPGAAYAVCRRGEIDQGFIGRFTYNPDSPAVGPESVWDLASVSKVIGTTSAVMLLVQSGQLDLDKTVASVIPEFATHGKEKITFRNLMVHDSGLIAFRPYQESFTRAEDVMAAIYNEELTYATGSQCVYSDLSMILVGEAIHRLTGRTLDVFLRNEVFAPLGMNHTGYFRPDTSTFLNAVSRTSCVPTERIEPWRRTLRQLRGVESAFAESPEHIQGEVHDPTATVLDGVAGHAGLFATLGDLITFMRNFTSSMPMLFARETIAEFTKCQGSLSTRALGWDTKSPEGSSAGSKFGPRSVGHTGYTGTSIWCDPDDGTFAILLSNRVHPTSENTKILTFRPEFHEIATESPV